VKRRDFVKLGGLSVVVPWTQSALGADGNATASSAAVAEPARQTPIAGQADVVVCDGGPAGVAAAAARQGAKTLLLENNDVTTLGIWVSP